MKKKCQRNEIEELAKKIDEKAGALAREDAEVAAVRDASVASLSAAAHVLRSPEPAFVQPVPPARHAIKGDRPP